MTIASGNVRVCPEKLSLRQVFCTPVSWSGSVDFERGQRAYGLMRRWESAITRHRSQLRRLQTRIPPDVYEWDESTLALVAEFMRVRRELAAYERLLPGVLAAGSAQVVLSSSMLKASYEYCTQDDREGLHFILGLEYGGCRFGTELRTFPYAVQSVVAAEGDFSATHRIAIETHETGHCRVAMIHSHPGRGRGANHPSGTDLRTQRLIELTSQCASGIWSRDGNLRFYGAASENVQIIGTHMERQHDGTWQLISTAE